MPTSTQDVGLLERRIIELLTTTNLTFKEIICKLESEHLAASIGIIRRINRDNRYRRPRYDSKLTPAQRESLVEELRDHQGVKPNLSLLAKRYGVCHGSVWYWWDKLNRVNRTSPHSHSSFSTKNLFKRSHQLHLLSSARHHQAAAAAAAAAHLIKGKDAVFKQRLPTNTNSGIIIGKLESGCDDSPPPPAKQFNLVGRVGIITSGALNVINLPILMFSAPSASENVWPMMSPDAESIEHDGEIKSPDLRPDQVGLTKMFGSHAADLHERVGAIPLIKA